MRFQRLLEGFAFALPEPDRAGDVSEEEGDGAAGESMVDSRRSVAYRWGAGSWLALDLLGELAGCNGGFGAELLTEDSGQLLELIEGIGGAPGGRAEAPLFPQW